MNFNEELQLYKMITALDLARSNNRCIDAAISVFELKFYYKFKVDYQIYIINNNRQKDNFSLSEMPVRPEKKA